VKTRKFFWRSGGQLFGQFGYFFFFIFRHVGNNCTISNVAQAVCGTFVEDGTYIDSGGLTMQNTTIQNLFPANCTNPYWM
jgi:hypothetical protein